MPRLTVSPTTAPNLLRWEQGHRSTEHARVRALFAWQGAELDTFFNTTVRRDLFCTLHAMPLPMPMSMPLTKYIALHDGKVGTEHPIEHRTLAPHFASADRPRDNLDMIRRPCFQNTTVTRESCQQPASQASVALETAKRANKVLEAPFLRPGCANVDGNVTVFERGGTAMAVLVAPHP